MSTHALIREIEDKVISRPVSERTRMLRQIVALLRSQAATLPKVQLDVFDAVIQRLSVEAALETRVELAEILAPMKNAPDGVVRQLAHDLEPVARMLIATSGKLQSEDLLSIAVTRGQKHMRLIADRPELNSDITDILVMRGDSDVVSAVASNVSAKFSETGFQALLHRAKADEAIRKSVTKRAKTLNMDLAKIMKSDAFVAEETSKQEKSANGAKLNTAMENGTQALLEVAATIRVAGNIDEQEVEELITNKALNDHSLNRFAETKRYDAIVYSLMHLGKLDYVAAEKLMISVDPKMLLFLLRSHNVTWSTSRAILSARKVPLPNMAEMRRYMDMFNQTTPDVAKKAYKVRSAH
jgi:uncharacterized protein (DUF2336 family)